MRKTRTTLVVGVAAAAMTCAAFPFMSVTPAVAGLTGDDGLIAIGTDRGIEVFDPDGDGSDRRVLIASDGPTLMPSYPTWSPRGNKIAYVQSGGLWVADADGSNPVMISGDESVRNPAWSPDGRISYSQGGGTFMIRDADGSHPQQVMVDGPISSVGWTPDGRILTSAYPPDYPVGQPFIADGDGTRWRQITGLNGSLFEDDTGQTQLTASSSGLLGYMFDTPEGDGPFVGIVGFDGIRHVQRPGESLWLAFDLAFSPTGDRVATISRHWDWETDPEHADETVLRVNNIDLTSDDLVSGGWGHVLAGPVRGVDWQPKCTIVASPAAEAGFEQVIGTLGDDLICAAEGDTVIYGGGGNDVIYAGAGRDTVYGGTGNDVIVGGYGNDELRGGDGNDLINSRNDRRVPDTINGGPDRNTCIANRRETLTHC